MDATDTAKEPDLPARASRPLGEIVQMLVRAGVVTEKQVTYAQRVHAKLTAPRPLLLLLRELGYVTEQQVRDALRAHRVGVRLGALLVELGHLRESDLGSALEIQQRSSPKRRLGEILLEHHFIDEHVMLDVLSCQLGFPLVDPTLVELDRNLIAQAPLPYYAKHGFLPIRIEAGEVLVAFVDPQHAQSLDAAKKLFGANIVPAISRRETIQDALRQIERRQNAGPARAEDDERTIVGIVNALIDDAAREGASDIHIEPMSDRLRVRIRVDGVLVPLRDLPLTIAPAISSRIKIMGGANIAERRRHQDGRVAYERDGSTIDLRLSIYVTVHGEKLVMRLLTQKRELLRFQDIGMAPRMLERFREEAVEAPGGIVLITGPTGSGKTTTLYSAIAHINRPDVSIVTAEDPVEYQIEGVSQCSINAKLNLTFEETLRHIVRQDPDVIVIGEIRDTFSAETAIQAALTGHKVFSTFHTEDSIGGLLRLLNLEIEAFLVSSTVVSVVAQRLVRRLCDECAVDHVIDPRELRRLGYSPRDVTGARFRSPRGCGRCRYRGYRGRLGVFELLVMNEPVRDAILTRKSSGEIRRISTESTGLVTLLEDGLAKAAAGQTSLDEVFQNLPLLTRPRPLHELRRLTGA
ncbi:MAG TPA: GspE/PulE family protein [Myxococcota bacterium]|jgi:type IV pilus assembly protein PilB|nr:GspE/PulE family protein [Myxococcota bacterium]